MIFTSVRQSRRTVSSPMAARKRATLRLLGFVLSSATSASLDQGRDRFESAPRNVGHAAAGTTQKVVRKGSSRRLHRAHTLKDANRDEGADGGCQQRQVPLE